MEYEKLQFDVQQTDAAGGVTDISKQLRYAQANSLDICSSNALKVHWVGARIAHLGQKDWLKGPIEILFNAPLNLTKWSTPSQQIMPVFGTLLTLSVRDPIHNFSNESPI